MNLRDYQRRTEQARDQAGETSPAPVQGCQLTAAAGTVATAVLQGQHGLLTDGGYRDALRAGLADLLHRTAALATTAGLDLSEIAITSLATLDDLDATCALVTYTALPAFDADYPEAEQLPRRLTIRFDENTDPSGLRVVTATLTSTHHRRRTDRPPAPDRNLCNLVIGWATRSPTTLTAPMATASTTPSTSDSSPSWAGHRTCERC